MSAVLRLGVLEDGSNRHRDVPPDVRRSLRLARGLGTSVLMAIVRPTGEAVDLSGGRVVLTAKRCSFDDEQVFEVEGVLRPEQGLGRVDLPILGSQTRNLFHGRFVYDVVFIDAAGDVEEVVPVSPLILGPSASRYADSDAGVTPDVEIVAGGILVVAGDAQVIV